MLVTELIHESGDHEVNEVLDSLWSHVEAWCQRNDGGPGSGESCHAVDIDRTQRGLAMGYQKLPPFLEADHGRPVYQCAGDARGD